MRGGSRRVWGAMLLLAASCAPVPERVESRDGATRATDHAVDAPTPTNVSVRRYVLLDAAGDTVVVESVEQSTRWLELVRRLPRRGAEQRLVLEFAPDGRIARWDEVLQPSSSSRPERWRVIVTAESLHVVRGALIGEPVSIESFATRAPVIPWHEGSIALLDWAAQRERDSVRLVSGALLASSGTARVTRVGRDSLRADVQGERWDLAVDADGHIMSGVVAGGRLRVARVPEFIDDATLAAGGAPAGAPTVAAPEDLAAPTFAPAPDSVREEAFVVRAPDGVRLAGTLTHARVARTGEADSREAGRPPVVLLVSGSGPQTRDLGVPGLDGYRPFAELAHALAALGIASVRVDDRGVGGSGGVAFRATRAVEVSDWRTILRWLEARDDVLAHRVGVVGHSDGGHIALALAAQDSAVRTVVSLGTPSRAGRELAAWQRARWESVGDETMEVLTERLAALEPWLREWLRYDPAHETLGSRRAARGAPFSALLVHGETDGQVPVAQVHELARALRARGVAPVQVTRVPAVNHLLLSDAVGDVRGYARLSERTVALPAREAIVRWLAGSLGAPSGAAVRPPEAPPREHRGVP